MRTFVMFLMFAGISFVNVDAQTCGDSDLQNFRDSLTVELATAGLDKTRLDSILESDKLIFYPDILKKVEAVRKKSKKSSYNPYSNFLTAKSINRGKNFLHKHERILENVEKKYGVPREILVAFLRIESNFGANTGRYQVLGVFYSIACLGPSGAGVAERDWAKKHLQAFLLASQIHNFSPLDIRGSYMGAFGLPQFMPTSFLDFAIDGDGDGDIDLYSVEDAVPSIANYLVGHGWNTNPRRAVLRYNNSGRFADFIFKYSSRLK